MNAEQAFEAGLKFVFQAEGGYSNTPGDHGGATNFGVTQRVYDSWHDEKGMPHADVAGITEAEASQIYKDLYWDEIHLDELVEHCGEKLAICVFDTGVNTGPGRAVKILQGVVCRDNVDGLMGPTTWSMARKAQVIDGKNLVDLYLIERVNYYNRLADQNKSQQKFLAGWMNRVKNLRAYLATW